MNIKIIVNPNAGDGIARNMGFSVEKFLCDRGIEYSLDSTYRPGGAVGLAKKASETGFNLIVAVGGDGTINEVANGMAQSSSQLAIIPAGRKNDLARTLDIPINNINDACQIAFAGSIKKVDVGKINTVYFLNGVEMGLSFNLAKGRALHFLKTIAQIPKFKPINIRIKMGEVIKESKTIFLTIANGNYSSGGFCVAPQANFSDNLFDVCIAKFPGKARFLCHIPKIFKGNHAQLPYFSFLKTPEIEIDSSDSLDVKYDGEIMKDKAPYKISIAQHKISIKSI